MALRGHTQLDASHRWFVRAITTSAKTLIAAGTLGLLAAGCSPATSTVSGTVSFNGEPVARGSISLFPTDGKGSPSGGAIENGRYVIKGVRPGEKIVQLTAPVSAGVHKDDFGNDTQMFEELMPASWGRGSQEKITVTAGSMTKNFEITGPDPRKTK